MFFFEASPFNRPTAKGFSRKTSGTSDLDGKVSIRQGCRISRIPIHRPHADTRGVCSKRRATGAASFEPQVCRGVAAKDCRPQEGRAHGDVPCRPKRHNPGPFQEVLGSTTWFLWGGGLVLVELAAYLCGTPNLRSPKRTQVQPVLSKVLQKLSASPRTHGGDMRG